MGGGVGGLGRGVRRVLGMHGWGVWRAETMPPISKLMICWLSPSDGSGTLEARQELRQPPFHERVNGWCVGRSQKEILSSRDPGAKAQSYSSTADNGSQWLRSGWLE